MHLDEGLTSHQSPTPSIPVSSSPPVRSMSPPPIARTDEVQEPPQTVTPRRTRRQETPPATTATYLRTRITPTKKAGVVMLRSQSDRLALLPPQPLPESLVDSSSPNQPEGVPPTPRVIPPTPLQHRGDVARYDASYAGSRYSSPQDSWQTSAYSELPPFYANMMMPPPSPRIHHQELRYPYQPSRQEYEGPGIYPRISPRPEYLAPSAPYARSSSMSPFPSRNPSLQPSERFASDASQTQANAIQPSVSPSPNPNLSPQPARSERLLMQPPPSSPSSNLKLPQGQAASEGTLTRTQPPPSPSPNPKRREEQAAPEGTLTRTQPPPSPSPNPKLREGQAAPEGTLTRPPPSHQMASLCTPEPPEPPGNPEAPFHAPLELPAASERPPSPHLLASSNISELSQRPPITPTPIPLSTTASTPTDDAMTSDPAKKPGRPSKKALGLIETTFAELDASLADLSQMTGLTHMQLMGRWQADVKGSNSFTTWNTYLKFFSENKDAEARRVTTGTYVDNTAFRSQCYRKYQEEVPDWQERLALYQELESYSTKGMTVAQRARAFRQFENKFKRLVSCCLTILVIYLRHHIS
jgi:hypothetical protein